MFGWLAYWRYGNLSGCEGKNSTVFSFLCFGNASAQCNLVTFSSSPYHSHLSFHSAPFFSLFRHLKASFIYWDKSHQLGKYIWYTVLIFYSLTVVDLYCFLLEFVQCFRAMLSFVCKKKFGICYVYLTLSFSSSFYYTVIFRWMTLFFFAYVLLYTTLFEKKRKQNKKDKICKERWVDMFNFFPTKKNTLYAFLLLISLLFICLLLFCFVVLFSLRSKKIYFL